MNINQTCNAFWNGGHRELLPLGRRLPEHRRDRGGVRPRVGPRHGRQRRRGRRCRNSSEGYADIAAIYRLQTSCVGHGFFQTLDDGCGQTADGTGFNTNESADRRAALRHRLLGRARRRLGEARRQHAGHARSASSAAQCITGTGPCGRQVHCAAAPVAPGGLGPRDARPDRGALQPTTARRAFIVGNRVFYQGSGNIGAWHACTCGASVQRLRRRQRLHAVDHRRRRQRQPERRHAAHDARSSTPSTATASPAPRRRAQNSGCAAGPSRRADADRHRRATSRSRSSWTRGRRRHPLLGVPQRGPRRLRLRQGADRRGDRPQLHRHPGRQRPHVLLQRGRRRARRRPATAAPATA